MTVTVLHRLPPLPGMSHDAMLGFHRTEFKYVREHAACRWCACLPITAFNHVMSQPQYSGLQGGSVLFHDVSGAARTDEETTRQINLLKGVTHEYNFQSAELAYGVAGHAQDPTHAYDQAAFRELYAALGAKGMREPQLFTEHTFEPIVTREYKVLSHPPRSNCCLNCGVAASLACSRCSGAVFCNRE